VQSESTDNLLVKLNYTVTLSLLQGIYLPMITNKLSEEAYLQNNTTPGRGSGDIDRTGTKA
jgi:hypothetical protein